MVEAAWWNEAFRRQKVLPKLSKIVRRPPSEKQIEDTKDWLNNIP